jgi:hypothetical protein
MRNAKRHPADAKDLAELLRELRSAVQESDSELVGKSIEEIVDATRRVRGELWSEKLSESSSTRTSSSSR